MARAVLSGAAVTWSRSRSCSSSSCRATSACRRGFTPWGVFSRAALAARRPGGTEPPRAGDCRRNAAVRMPGGSDSALNGFAEATCERRRCARFRPGWVIRETVSGVQQGQHRQD